MSSISFLISQIVHIFSSTKSIKLAIVNNMNQKKELKKMQSVVKEINLLRNKYINMSDEALRQFASTLKERRQTEDMLSLLPEAFALVKEASRRTIGKEHYDVQLMSAISLCNGWVSEAKTGEGKTITIFLTAFLHSLNGMGVHVVTVNDYLARRDAQEASKVFDLLGLTVGCIQHETPKPYRKRAYQCDITYVSNMSIGFDYLRDHLAFDPHDVVLRGLNCAIIDEVDSVLIDDAKTPVIISGPGPQTGELLYVVDEFVKSLNEGKRTEAEGAEKILGAEAKEDGDYIKNEKNNKIFLTEDGIKKTEKMFGVDYRSNDALMLQRMIGNALRANYLMEKDHHYLVKDGIVYVIDENTGRIADGRRYADGVHQAIEAKEHLAVQRENVTVATITFQSLFNKYKIKSGLTGTAMTSAKEFKDVYNMEVIEIPTNKPMIRQDLEDCMFRTKKEKWNAVVKEALMSKSTGQPLLIGTVNIEDSEIVSKMLSENNIQHNTLNAKNEALEAEIIAQAGRFGAITVATNMAGRGTDIVLDEKAKSVGGLKIIGTERHDSRRIDNQLKGRGGRQGDPGTTQFYISLEDKLMRVFADKSSVEMLMMMVTEPGEPLQHKMLSRIVQGAQDAIETEQRLARESLMKFDAANNDFREQIYGQKEQILFNPNPRMLLAEMFYDLSDDLIEKYIPDGTPANEWNIDDLLNEYFSSVTFVNIDMNTDGMEKKDLKASFRQLDDVLINMKEEQIGNLEIARSVERSVMLRMTDRHWATFLNTMEFVKKSVGNQVYAQKDPVLEYKKKGVELFNDMIDNICLDVIANFMNCQVKYDQ